MLFNSLIFLFAFLPVTYVVYWCLRSDAAASHLAHDHRLRFLRLLGSAFLSADGVHDARELFGRSRIPRHVRSAQAQVAAGDRADHHRSAAAWLLQVRRILHALDQRFRRRSSAGAPSLPVLDVILPIGISFYTFHTITYIVDAYRGHITPTRSFWEFGAYVSLFSQLVAGPIVRFRQIEEDLENVGAAQRRAGLALGLSFLAFGLFEKVIVADCAGAFRRSGARRLSAPVVRRYLARDAGLHLSAVLRFLRLQLDGRRARRCLLDYASRRTSTRLTARRTRAISGVAGTSRCPP